MAGDFIPRADRAFLDWSKTLVAYAEAHVAAFKVDEGALTDINTLLTAYQTAYTAAEDPNRGKVDVLTKNEARDALKLAVRTFVKAYLTYNPAVSDTDKESTGLPLHDTARTPVPPPSAIPEIELDSSIIRQIIVHFRDEANVVNPGVFTA